MYQLDNSRYVFIADALLGTGGFRPSVIYNPSTLLPETVGDTYLERFPRETMERFARRNAVAMYTNLLAPACDSFVGYMMREQPARDLKHQYHQAIIEDTDLCGSDIDVFWASFMRNLLARGAMFLLVEKPEGDIAADRVAPYFVPIVPEVVASWETDDYGKVKTIAIMSTEDGKDIYRCWDESRWWKQIRGAIGDPSLILEEGEHGLGVCPVLMVSESGQFPCYSGFSAIADICRRHFNAASERDSILSDQTFSLLVYQIPVGSSFDAEQVGVNISTNNMLTYVGESPSYISPSSGPADTYSAVLEELKKLARDVAMSVEIPQTDESGYALQIRFQKLNSALSRFARMMEDLELRAWDMVNLWMGIKAPVAIEWPHEYSIRDVGAELTMLSQMIDTQMPSAVLKEQQKRIIQLQFNTLAQEDLDKLMDAVDEFDMNADAVMAGDPMAGLTPQPEEKTPPQQDENAQQGTSGPAGGEYDEIRDLSIGERVSLTVDVPTALRKAGGTITLMLRDENDEGAVVRVKVKQGDMEATIVLGTAQTSTLHAGTYTLEITARPSTGGAVVILSQEIEVTE